MAHTRKVKGLSFLLILAAFALTGGAVFLVHRDDGQTKFRTIGAALLKPLPGSTDSGDEGMYDLRALVQGNDDAAIANAVTQYCRTDFHWNAPGNNNPEIYAASGGNDSNTVNYFTNSSYFVRKGDYVNMIAFCYSPNSTTADPQLDEDSASHYLYTSFYLYKKGGTWFRNGTWTVEGNEVNGYPSCTPYYKGMYQPDCIFKRMRS